MCKLQRPLIGLGIIFLGLFFLLNNFRVFGSVNVDDIIISAMFAVGGFVFLSVYLKNRRQWWALIPGFVLLGVGGLIFVDSTNIFPPQFETASILLFSISAAFWLIFIKEKNHWWAAIPGGVLSSIAFFITVDNIIYNDAALPVLFTGFALTFWVLWLIRKESATSWAIFPAMVLSGIAIIGSTAKYMDQLWPLILVVVGGWVLLKNVVKRKQFDAATPNGAPPSNGNENIA